MFPIDLTCFEIFLCWLEKSFKIWPQPYYYVFCGGSFLCWTGNFIDSSKPDEIWWKSFLFELQSILRRWWWGEDRMFSPLWESLILDQTSSPSFPHISNPPRLNMCFSDFVNYIFLHQENHMTRNQMRVAIQSGCVTKIRALPRWSKNDFPPEFQNCQMHSFPIMYNTMGSKVDGLAVRDHFLQKMA